MQILAIASSLTFSKIVANFMARRLLSILQQARPLNYIKMTEDDQSFFTQLLYYLQNNNICAA